MKLIAVFPTNPRNPPRRQIGQERRWELVRFVAFEEDGTRWAYIEEIGEKTLGEGLHKLTREETLRTAWRVVQDDPTFGAVTFSKDWRGAWS